ncbi:MAG: hypothetical protein HYW89_04140 [Candidatus Sungiibacteriota bacterium]|uniref:Uncharacterized protein n=1 Tax=Candidatus Sungiibacteriota bacterium TaxID=2750080 RepID=A0A7T5UQJ2_9BACT|nr:MAG: hypothetical protein HYW89_04140 [Candidatus Sungbacteria bacterium]
MVEDQEKPSAEEEIRQLEQKLEEKKREFALRGVEVPEEKELLREVLRKQVEEVRPPLSTPAVTPPAGAHLLTDDLKKKADEVKNQEERETQVRTLIEIALTRGINNAVKVAESATPYLLDELHDHLVDDYYDKLVQLRKIKKL